MDHLATEAATAAMNTDELLADLDLTPELEAADDEAIVEVLDPEVEAALETDIERSEAYEDQEVTTVSAEAAPADETPAPKKRERKASGAAKASKPKIERDLTKLDLSVFEVTSGETATAESRDALIAMRPKQKKIGEKFDNLFQAIASNRAPSVYVMQCFKVLDERKTVTASDLVAALKASDSRKGSGYNEGTARSQAGQIMALFNVVGIATRSGQTLNINANSAIAAKLRSLS